jgi:anti-sigma regulatory factor (Ser/Thr protein kinase)
VLLVTSCGYRGTPCGVAEYHARFPSAHASVGKARRAVVAFARYWFSGDDLSDIESAVGEALANCAEHGYVNGTNIDVRCRCDGRELTIEIADAGKGFERWNACEFVKPLSSAPRGYGTFIMRRLMDEIEYTERGTRVRLLKRRAVVRAEESGERFA